MCAGRGERLRPLTDTTPKPLLEIDGEALLVRHLRRLHAAGVTHVVVNVSWLAPAIVRAIGDGSAFGVDVTYSVEGPGALETLGGIRQALPWLGEQPFWVVNGDVYTDFDFAIASTELSATIAARLVLVPNPPHNPDGDFAVQHGLASRAADHPRIYTYAGVGLYDPALFAHVAKGRAALGPLLFRAAERNVIAADVYTGRWDDVGTIERLEALRRWRATRQNG